MRWDDCSISAAFYQSGVDDCEGPSVGDNVRDKTNAMRHILPRIPLESQLPIIFLLMRRRLLERNRN